MLVHDGGIPGGGFVGGAGGTMKQMGAGGFDSQFQIESLSELAKQNEGKMIELSIPLVDYGFQGEFNNAHVSVSKGSMSGGAGTFISLQYNPTIKGYSPTGSVTIEEYSPMLLSGHFSAPLVHSDAVREATRLNPSVNAVLDHLGSSLRASPASACSAYLSHCAFLFAGKPEVMTRVLGIVYHAIATHLTYEVGLTKPMAQVVVTSGSLPALKNQAPYQAQTVKS